MPELPEVECLRRSLEPILLGRTIASASLLRADILSTDPAAPAASASRSLLAGLAVADLQRHGKQLAIIARGPRASVRILVIQLGMSGQLLFFPNRAAPSSLDHVHARWSLSQSPAKSAQTRHSGILVFRDPRRFGGIWASNSLDSLRKRWNSLGPDALSITPDILRARLGRTSRPVKSALLDQSILAGVGNIYADEALFRAGINPAAPSDSLAPPKLKRLATSIRGVLADSIASGGSTLRDYRNATGKTGEFQTRRSVYGRGGEPCYGCGRPLTTARLAQRTTTWCASCQP
ncbi:MAG: bifunctional DNA-formamidopyrimidine glycosylase/DNA-(apurinic or apyrimidinic site) lyase [Phycisphaerales bacterium]